MISRCKDGASRMQSILIELLRRRLFSRCDLESRCKGTHIILYRYYTNWLIIYQFRRNCLKNVKNIPLLDYFT